MDARQAREIGSTVARELVKKECEDHYRAAVSLLADVVRNAYVLDQLEVLPGFERESKYAATQVILSNLEKDLRSRGKGEIEKYLPVDKPMSIALADEVWQLKNLVDKDYIREKAEDVNVLAARYLTGFVGFDGTGIVHDMMTGFAKCQCDKDLYTEADNRKITRNQVYVEHWEEEGRIHVGVQDKETGDYLISWWDDGAREMFDNSTFKLPGLGFENSVLEVAEKLGILAK